jgi:Tol biopolymer transport system component
LDGGGESAIAGLPSPASDPAVSPDGARLAFIGPVNGSAGPWTSAIDGSAAAAVPGTPTGAIVASPTWCKGGDTIVDP